MKNFTLLEQYKFSKKIYSISMPLTAISLLIVALIMFFLHPNIPWLGIIFLAMAGMTMIIFVFVRKYMNKKIAELESKDDKTDDVAKK